MMNLGLTCRTVRLENERYLCEVFKDGRLIITSRTYTRPDAARRGALRSMIHAGERIQTERMQQKNTMRVLRWFRRASGGTSTPLTKPDLIQANKISKKDIANASHCMNGLVARGLLDHHCRGLWSITPAGLSVSAVR